MFVDDLLFAAFAFFIFRTKQGKYTFCMYRVSFSTVKKDTLYFVPVNMN